MAHKSKRMKEIAKLFDPMKAYKLDEAVAILKKCPPVKFDQSVGIAMKVGIDVKKSDQQVRGTVSLPHGTGKSVTLVVIAKGDKAKEATDAGADFVGADELLEKIKGGWTEFDVCIAAPDMMGVVGPLGKVLGPRGLMPSPRAGTVTPEIAKTVKEYKAGKVEFRNDAGGIVHAVVGKLSFDGPKLVENIQAFINHIQAIKPAAIRGQYIKGITISGTMTPGVRIAA